MAIDEEQIANLVKETLAELGQNQVARAVPERSVRFTQA